MFGKVTMYNTTKGYGYITGDNNVQYNVHRTNVRKPSGSLDVGEQVEFTATRNSYGNAAVNVKPY